MSTGRARDLRRKSTDAEQLLWNRLRDRQLQGEKFRRQVSLGSYVVDFVCFEKKLIVELDGGQHAHAVNMERDEVRSTALRAHGFQVLRFWNNDVMGNIEGVLESILSSLRD